MEWHLYDAAPPNVWVEVSKLHHPTEGKPYMESKYLNPPEVPAYLDTVAGQPDVFVGVATRSTKGRKKEHAGPSRTIWCDWDSSDFPPAVLPPSLMVRTPHGMHIYWFLDTYVPPEQFEELNKVILDSLGGQAAGADKCWYRNSRGRVPGTIHSETGETVTILASPGYTYPIGDIMALKEVDRKLKMKVLTGDARGYPSRSELDFAVVRGLLQAGMSPDTITTIYDTHRVGVKYRKHADPAHYLSTTLANAGKNVTVLAGEEGIQNRSDGLYSRSNKTVRKVATFSLNPLRVFFVDGEQDILECEVVCGGRVVVQQFPRDAFNSTRAFVTHLPRMEWQWLGSDNDVRNLLPYLMSNMTAERVNATQVAGRTGKFFVLPTGTLSAKQIWAVGEGPVTYVPGPVPPPNISLTDEGDDPEEILETLLETNTVDVMVPAVGWTLATPFKPVLEGLGFKFPLLNIYGTQGSGKTTLIMNLMDLWGYQSKPIYDSTTTRFVMLALLGSTNAMPVAIAELRSADMVGYLLRYVRLMYDLGYDPRGRADQTIKTYRLTAPTIVDGEDALLEPAALERLIGVHLRKATVAPGTSASTAHADYQALDKGGFITEYLQWTLTLTPSQVRDLVERARETLFDLGDRIPHRVANNFSLVLFGWLAAQAWLGVEDMVSEEAILPSLTHSYDIQSGRHRSHVDNMVELVVNTLANDRHTATFFYKYDPEQGLLSLHFGSAMSWYELQARRRGQMLLGRDALAAQLDEAPYCVGSGLLENRWCYHLSLPKAAQVLDVPSHLTFESVTLTFDSKELL